MQFSNVLVLGIGNVLWADEGFGVRAVDAFNAAYQFGDDITLMDGGTQGLYLVPYIQQSDVVVVFDAVDYGLAPGTIKVVHDEDVPKFMGAKKMSLHQTGFQEVLATAELLGNYPKKILLIGVQPEEIDDYGGSLRDVVKAQIQPCINIAIDYLTELGFEIKPATISEEDSQVGVNHHSLSMERYEEERPSNDAAWRAGDQRILANQGYKFDPKPHDVNSPNLAVEPGKRLKS